jgi:hypothetical protein
MQSADPQGMMPLSFFVLGVLVGFLIGAYFGKRQAAKAFIRDGWVGYLLRNSMRKK